jgi:release factor glutamine methyltransferase
LSHITGNTTFNGVMLDIHKGVLAPRNETELLCNRVVSILQSDRNLTHCVDLCCGSGNIAISIKRKCDFIKMTAIDIDKKAVDNTLHNIKKNNVQVDVIEGDFYQTMLNRNLRFDAIISNPPYVSAEELDNKMLKYEDKKCFTNSTDDLFFYQVLIENYQKIFRNTKHFLLALEIGYNQKNRIMELLKKQGLLTYATFYQDLNKHDRVVIIYRN